MSKYIYTASTSHTGPLNLALEITDHITPSIAPPRTLFFASPSEFSERTEVGLSQRCVGESQPLSAKFMIFRVSLLCVVISTDKTDPTASQGVREALSCRIFEGNNYFPS